MRRLFLMTMILCVTFSTFALKRDPEYREARRQGAVARMLIHAVDDRGQDVSNATIHVFMGMNFRPKGYTLDGHTDGRGMYVLEGKTCGDEILIDVIKDGYYSSSLRLSFAEMGAERQVLDGCWQPFGNEERIELRRIVNPRDLIVVNKFIDVPATNVWIGFDMAKGDFVAPMGRGETPDFDIKAEWDGLPSWESRFCRSTIRFREDKAGGCYVRNVKESKFPYPYSAQEDHVYHQREVEIVDRNGDPGVTKVPFAGDSSLVTRTRCETDDKGILEKANYGAVRRFEIGPSRRGIPLLRIAYVFNPTPNDPNIEEKR